MSEAERLADDLDAEFVTGRISNQTGRKAATELRRLQGEVEALRKDKLAADALRANLAASWFYGRWVAETPNEQEQQALMEQAGWWPWADEDALVAAVDKARLAARPGGEG